MQQAPLSKFFLIFLIVAVLFACYKIFEPFLIIIIAATILSTIFYNPYQQLVKILRGRQKIAALIMCILVSIVVIVPLANFLVYTAQRSVDAYEMTIQYINGRDLPKIVQDRFWEKYNFLNISSETIKGALVDIAKKVNEWLVEGAGAFLKGTTNLIFSMVMIIFTMFFFFIDGKRMLEKLMHWTPLSNKYDREIFKKFQDVSSSTIVSTFATAIAQGLVGALGFMIVGVPAFFAGIGMAFLSLIPYVGAGFVWLPVSMYLLLIGKIWQGIFLIAWGAGVVSVVDNVLKAYIIKDKAQVHPIFIIFSILGGISLFGFWGVIFGPLIISLAVTVLHIYEMEYGDVLEK
jgi:predicted PurR-regulated permease PerM